MSVRSYSQGSVCNARPDETLRAAAQRMAKEGMGSLVVVEEDRPVGVLTDRDIVLHVVAGRRDADQARVREALERRAVTIDADAPLPAATDLMRRRRLRRLPVVDAEGGVVGVIAVDDVVRLLAEEISGLARIATAQLPVGVSAGAEAAGAAAAGLKPPPGLRLVEHYRSDVKCLRADTSARALADMMKAEAVGCVVATSDGEDAIGIVTDRDLAVRVVASGDDPDATPVSAIMSTPPITAQATQPLEEVVAKMSAHGIRRLPIVSGSRAVGMVTYDDLLVAFGRELAQLGEAARAEVRHEQRAAQADRVRQGVETQLRELGGKALELGGRSVDVLLKELDGLRKRFRQR
ncbi:MAG: CBS domain-containing protein [Myxococcota bacterium]